MATRSPAPSNLDLLETLFAPDATLAVRGNTFNGRDAVLGWHGTSTGPFIQNHHWVALPPAFRTDLQPNGNTADIYFQCILVDPATDMFVGKLKQPMRGDKSSSPQTSAIEMMRE